jgi:hypothetical protein
LSPAGSDVGGADSHRGADPFERDFHFESKFRLPPTPSGLQTQSASVGFESKGLPIAPERASFAGVGGKKRPEMTF